MRDKLGILVVEESGGSVAIQLFENPEKALATFDELKGKIGEKPWRATFMDMRWQDGVVTVSKVEGKNLPIIPMMDDKHDGWVIGEGPRIKTEEIK